MDITLDTKTVRYANGGCEHDPALPGVVLVHGAGMNRTVFQLQTRYLAHHGYRVAAIDLPGHGGSEGPAIETVPEMGAWLADVIVALDMGPAHVSGHSMGTFIGIELLHSAPRRWRRSSSSERRRRCRFTPNSSMRRPTTCRTRRI